MILSFPADGNLYMIWSKLKEDEFETELGKLYISYPMVEALKEISLEKQEYETFYLPLEESGNYKDIVRKKKDFQNFKRITRDMWYAACNASRKQAYLIVDYKAECTYTKFLQTVTQKTIYHAQKEKFIKENRVIAILNSIPLFLIEYFKEDFWNIVVK